MVRGTVIIVAGKLTVDPGGRHPYLAGCRDVLVAARAAPGCLDFALSADPVDPARINVFERWESEAALHAFRGSGPSGDQLADLLEIDVREYRVAP
jgi:quinol monooxygenase YgiN